MDALIWVLLPLITAVGSALLAFYIMQARLEVVVAKEREALVEARAMMKGHERQLEDRVRMTEEETKRRAFDSFLGDIRVEERHYMRENKSLFTNTKSMVLQERLYFRNLPLSNWVEHELTVEQGQTADLANLARAASVFAGQNAVLHAGAQPGAAPVNALPTSETTPMTSGLPTMMAPRPGTAETEQEPELASVGTRRGFGGGLGNGRSASPGVAKVTTLSSDGAPGKLTFSPRFSQSRLLRG
jgi:hypothetical protein